MNIKILGPGCKKCDQTAARVAAVVEACGADAEVEKVTDMMTIAGFGVMATPAVVVDVGRLDEESKGLVLLTNDGDLANQLAHPRYGVRKVYQVQVAGEIPPVAPDQGQVIPIHQAIKRIILRFSPLTPKTEML